MMTKPTFNAYVLKLPALLLLLIFTLLVMAAYQGYVWWQATMLNQAYDSRRLLKQQVQSDAPLHAYTVGYLIAQQKKSSHDIALAAKAFTLAEAAEDIEIAARAKFALGNLYFDLALLSADIAAGGSHQQAVAQIELAREAYKGALRLKPDLYAARFNLELLDRRSPDKRTQAWLAETDGVTLQPFKRNGTAMMRDNTRRGLP